MKHVTSLALVGALLCGLSGAASAAVITVNSTAHPGKPNPDNNELTTTDNDNPVDECTLKEAIDIVNLAPTGTARQDAANTAGCGSFLQNANGAPDVIDLSLQGGKTIAITAVTGGAARQPLSLSRPVRISSTTPVTLATKTRLPVASLPPAPSETEPTAGPAFVIAPVVGGSFAFTRLKITDTTEAFTADLQSASVGVTLDLDEVVVNSADGSTAASPTTDAQAAICDPANVKRKGAIAIRGGATSPVNLNVRHSSLNGSAAITGLCIRDNTGAVAISDESSIGGFGLGGLLAVESGNISLGCLTAFDTPAVTSSCSSREVLFAGNTGAIRVGFTTAGAAGPGYSLRMNRTAFESNTSSSIALGSALTLSGDLSGRQVRIADSSIGGVGVGNTSTAESGYGAVLITGGAKPDLQIERSTFEANEANGTNAKGGAIACISDQAGGTVSILNSTFSGNKAAGFGGALYASFNCVIGLNFTTVSGNQADRGGGLSRQFATDTAAASFTLLRSVLAGNTATSAGGDCQAEEAAAVSSAGFNFIGSNAGCPSFQDADSSPLLATSLTANGDQIGDVSDGASALNPKLKAIAQNEGPTRTLQPDTGSALIDRIAGCTATIDQTSRSRPLDGDNSGGTACDVGAYELAETPGGVITASRVTTGATTAAAGDTVNMLDLLLANNTGEGMTIEGFEIEALGTGDDQASVQEFRLRGPGNEVIFTGTFASDNEKQTIQLPTPLALPDSGVLNVKVEYVFSSGVQAGGAMTTASLARKALGGLALSSLGLLPLAGFGFLRRRGMQMLLIAMLSVSVISLVACGGGSDDNNGGTTTGGTTTGGTTTGGTTTGGTTTGGTTTGGTTTGGTTTGGTTGGTTRPPVTFQVSMNKVFGKTDINGMALSLGGGAQKGQIVTVPQK